MRNKKQYDIEYAKTNCKRVYLLLHKEKDADILNYLEQHKPIQSEIKRLIREELRKENNMKNKMRNEQLLQNYSPSQFRVDIGQNGGTKDRWLAIFNNAIEDLNAGNYINGKSEKNTVEYWQRQIKLLTEFEPK